MLQDGIGRTIRRLREGEGMTQDELARALQDVGLPWRRITVAEVEAGARGLSFAEAILVAIALGVTLAELLPEVGVLALTAETSAEAGEIRRFLQGTTGAADDAYNAFDMPWRRDVKEKSAARRAAGREAEYKAARRFGIEPNMLSDLAFKRWGRSLTEERNARLEEAGATGATGDRLRALRGHVTRDLYKELEADVERRTKRKPSRGRRGR